MKTFNPDVRVSFYRCIYDTKCALSKTFVLPYQSICDTGIVYLSSHHGGRIAFPHKMHLTRASSRAQGIQFSREPTLTLSFTSTSDPNLGFLYSSLTYYIHSNPAYHT